MSKVVKCSNCDSYYNGAVYSDCPYCKGGNRTKDEKNIGEKILVNDKICEIKDINNGGYQLYDNEIERLISIGDIVLYKKKCNILSLHIYKVPPSQLEIFILS